MKSQRLGLLMIAASLIVIALITYLLLQHQVEARNAQTRAHGINLVRSISAIPYDQLVSDNNSTTPLNALLNVQGIAEYGYGTVVDTNGKALSEITSPGTLVPPTKISTEPSAWFGEQPLVSPGDGRKIREFYGPIMRQGELAGFVRLGFFEPRLINIEQISFLSLLSLPIFLLTPLFYYLMQREIKPLGDISQQLHQAMTSGPDKGLHIHPSGEMRGFIKNFNQFVELNQSRLRTIEGEKGKMLAASRMISYKKDKIETVLQAIPEAIVVLDESGTATFANAKLEPMLGTKPDSIIGKKPQAWCSHEGVLDFLSHLYAGASNAWRVETMEYTPADAPERRICVTAYPLFSAHSDNERQGTLVLFRDTTQENIARNVGSDFVAQVSHELKTPLNTLNLYAETLLSDAGKDESIRIEAINVIHDEVQRMNILINNLLNISKMEMGNFTLERKLVRLADLLNDAFNNVSTSERSEGIKFSARLPNDLGPVSLDKDLFRIAINNLLTNAVKYNKTGGSVVLTAEDTQEAIVIKVRDTGIGIPAADLGNVFNKFYRASNAQSAKQGGHGLGLYLARQIVELHHGQLHVASEPGKFTEFTITLQKAAVHSNEAEI